MTRNWSDSTLQIPLAKSGSILMFADEIPLECDDLIDALRSELAPFKVWKQCAVEYFKQGNMKAFEDILTDILQSLKDSDDLNQWYLQQPDSTETLADIYLCLAAKEILNMFETKFVDNSGFANVTELMRKCNEYFGQADEKMKLYALSFLLKGFYFLVLGDIVRAEESFSSVSKRIINVQDASKKKYLYLSFIGMGMVHYSSGRFLAAAEWFSKALIVNPQCDPSLRTSLALSYYKMSQFDKASQSAQRAIALDSMDATALVLIGLVDLLEAEKNYVKRKDLRRNAFDCFSMANHLEPTNPVIWNLLANQYYHSWFSFDCLSGCSFIGNDTIIINVRSPPSVFVIGNLLRFNTENDSFVIKEVAEYPSEDNDGSQIFKLVVDSALSNRFVSGESSIISVKVNNLFAASSLIDNALKHGFSHQVKAESHFILGKVKHLQRNLLGAMESYKAALKEKPDFVLAAFGLAEIQFLRKEYKLALDIFEKVLEKHDSDKDTQAYVSLLRGMLKNEQTPMEKLKIVAANFQYDLELWKVQGFVRHNHSGVDCLEEALRCYQSCIDCHQLRGQQPSAEILNNVAQIYAILGRPEKSIRFIKEAIVSLAIDDSVVPPQELLQEVEFESLLYAWVESGIRLSGAIMGFEGTFTIQGSGSNSVDIICGEEILVGDMLMIVDSVSETSLKCHRLFWSEGIESNSFFLRIKRVKSCFHQATFQYWFNLATYLEACRIFRPSKLIYEALRNIFPSFDECYLRLAAIYRDVGNLEGALQILSKTPASVNAKEFNLAKGDILLTTGRAEEAKRSYELSIDKNPNAKKDPSLLLSIGNLYMNAQDPKMSYKYYFSVLQEHVRNMYAANGLGIVCAKKEEFDSAKQIFNKIRQLGPGSEDTMLSTNLAHTYLLEAKYVEAERLYLTAYKDDCKLSHRDGGYAYSILELAGCASFLSNRTDDALKYCLRSLHANLTKHALSNTSIVFEKYILQNQSRFHEFHEIFVDLIRFCRQFLKAGALNNKSSKSLFAERLKLMETLYVKLVSRSIDRESAETSDETVLGKRKFEE